MKKSNLLGMLAVTSSLLVPVALSPVAYSMSHEEGETDHLGHVTEEDLADQLTVADIYGQPVFDSEGNRIGEIKDISLAKDFGDDLKSQWSKAKKGTGEMTEETGTDTLSDMNPFSDQQTIYLSVGGLLGFGDSVISAPASSLSYNETEDRLELAYSKSTIVAFAEQAGESSEDVMSAKQQFDDEAREVEQALTKNRMLRGLQDSIEVSVEEGKIILRGALANEKLKELAGEVARKHTDLEIENYIEIEK